MGIIEKIFREPEVRDKPPVLVDIGASRSINPKWKLFAKHSICLAFDADERKMGYIVEESRHFKKLILYPSIISPNKEKTARFYLTKQPLCSSMLEPNQVELQAWSYADMFAVEKEVELPCTHFEAIFEEQKINYVDWFKTDSQGIDLKLFLSMGSNVYRNCLTLEFEPGLYPFYKNENTLLEILDTLKELDFWISELNIKGSQRISCENLNRFFSGFEKQLLKLSLTPAPGWVEIVFFNGFSEKNPHLGKREFLLGWLFAIAEKQYGFALLLALQGRERFDSPLFPELEKHTLHQIRWHYLNLPLFVANKAFRKYYRSPA